MMRSRAAPRHIAVAMAVASLTLANSAAAQEGPGRGAPMFGPVGGRGGFPIGAGIGLGVAVGIGILTGILSAQKPPPAETPEGEPPPVQPPPRGPQKHGRLPPRLAGAPILTKVKLAPRQAGGGGPPPPVRPGFVVPPASERRYVPDEVLVQTKGVLPPAVLRRLEAPLGLIPVSVSRIALLDSDVRLYRLRPGLSVASAIRALRRQRIVTQAEPNFVFELQEAASPPAATPRSPDAGAPAQYAVAALHLVEAHRTSTGANVRVAVIDSGIDETNPNLEGSVVERFDAIGVPFATHSHGTAMAGAIVAHRSLVGVAPKAQLIAVRAFAGSAATGTGSSFNVLRGLDFAAAHGARVVNMSFAGPRDLLLRQALEAARLRGIVAIAAAGNGGPSAKPLYPAAEDGIIAVTATDAAGKYFARANRGAYIAVSAPGVDVIAPGLGDSVQISTGTSIAAAETSGVAALVLALHPHATPDDVRRVLRNTARPLTGQLAATSAGLVDAAAAVREAH